LSHCICLDKHVHNLTVCALEAMLLILLCVMKTLSATPCVNGGIADDLAYWPITTMQQIITAHSPLSTSPQQGAMQCSVHKQINVNMLKHKNQEVPKRQGKDRYRSHLSKCVPMQDGML